MQLSGRLAGIPGTVLGQGPLEPAGLECAERSKARLSTTSGHQPRYPLLAPVRAHGACSELSKVFI